MLNREYFAVHATGRHIVEATLTDRSSIEAVLVTDDGTVLLQDLVSGERSEIARLTFDTAKLGVQIHSFQDYISVTQTHGTGGAVLNLKDREFGLPLERGDYCAEVSRFPIAFYSHEGKTNLIHGTDWNRLDITCLESGQLLTDRVVDYDSDSNYFDYFHGSLSIAPDSKSFVSNGWHWHPYGQITLYWIDQFLQGFETSHTDLKLTDDRDPENACFADWERPLCWIDKRTLGIGYNRGMGHYGKQQFPSEILIYDTVENRIVRRFPFNGFAISIEGDVAGQLYFDSERSRFIGLNKKTGLIVTDTLGSVLEKNRELKGFAYSSRHACFFSLDKERRNIELARLTA